ncbi:MAG: hypothetical protein CO094_09620 [Anaerolineae bacterium CG_4_9_14_3_um_filter_57_17]|nr:MAG: hypothetical protein CO094_09620 [Anaerolineae bacterium CG_4_9_14_3_um_filter_57_17]
MNTTPTDPLIGRQLSTFRIERVLGRGGMAQVYFGMDVKLQRPVAIKVIDARHRSKPAYAQRFIKEARAVARLRHENIIQIYYADDENGLYYYVMDYIDGEDLAGMLSACAARGDLLPAAEVIRIGRALAVALDFAHSQGIIHRDVKPSNVLLAKNGRVVLTDFGLALDLQQGSSGEAFGTPHYMPPEQARRSTDAVPQSDLYSLGVILYEMLTGVVPFDDESPTAVALKHITEAPPPPRSLNPALSPATESVLLRALSKKPNERYISGAALIDALESALENTRPLAEHILPLPPPPAAILAGKTRTLAQRPLAAPAGPTRKNRWPLIFLLAICAAAIFYAGNLLTPGRFNPLAFFRSPTPTATEIIPAVAATPRPSATLAPVTPSRTPRPSATATFSATAAPSETAITTATNPPSATNLPASPTLPLGENLPTATTTPQFVNYKRLWLYYDAYGLYLYNASDANRSISALSLERLLDDGSGANLFSGNEWSVFYKTLHPGRCMRIEIQSNPNDYLNPPVCKNYYLATRKLPAESPLIFWTAQAGSSEFRVLWQGQEMGRCELSAGFCEVFIP